MDRVQKAKELFKSGYNCSQSVVGAFADAFGFDYNMAMKMAEGMGGGMGRMRLTCGAVSGMAMLAGMKYSCAKAGDIKTRTKIYEKVREMSKDFKDKHGSIICSELLGSSMPADNGAAPEARTAQYYKNRPCVECIGDCAAIVQKRLLDEE